MKTTALSTRLPSDLAHQLDQVCACLGNVASIVSPALGGLAPESNQACSGLQDQAQVSWAGG